MELSISEHDRRSDILLGLSADDISARRNSIGASDMNIIMAGDPAAVTKLWQVKTGQAEPDDLSDVLAVQMGIWTEDLNLRWFEKQTGKKVSERKRKLVHPDYAFLSASLDGVTTHPENDQPCVVDAKHVGPFYYDLEKTLHKYTPQLVMQMAIRDVPWGLLSVFSGSNKWEWIGIERDELLEAQVIQAAKNFWKHVQDKTPPVDLPTVAERLPKSLMKKIDLSTSNTWGEAEARYLQHAAAAEAHKDAQKDLKALVPDDVGEVLGIKIKVKRDAGGALRFSKRK